MCDVRCAPRLSIEETKFTIIHFRKFLLFWKEMEEIKQAEEISMEKENGKPALSTIKPRSKPILSANEVTIFENCLQSTPPSSSPSSSSPSSHPHVEMTSLLSGQAFYFDNVLTSEECALLRKEIDNSSSLSFWCYGKENDPSVQAFRNAYTIEIHSSLFCDKIWQRMKHFFPSPPSSPPATTTPTSSCSSSSSCNSCSSESTNPFDIHISDNPDDPNYERDLIGHWLPIGLNPDSLFVRYPSEGSFAPHTDGRAIIDFNIRSHYSGVLYLNSVPKSQGAGTRFYDSKVTKELLKDEIGNRWTGDNSLILDEVEAKEGRFLIFHQSLVHEGVPPISPYLKYIIRSDVIFERTPKICNSLKDQEAYALFRKGEEVAENGEVDLSLQYFKKAFKLSPELAQIMGHC